MVNTNNCFFSCAVMLVFLIPGCTDRNGPDRKPVFQQEPEIIEIRPERPVRIKLKRGASGKYSWEISGDDAEKLIKANTQLKESLTKDE